MENVYLQTSLEKISNPLAIEKITHVNYTLSFNLFHESCDLLKKIHMDGIMKHHVMGWRRFLHKTLSNGKCILSPRYNFISFKSDFIQIGFQEQKTIYMEQKLPVLVQLNFGISAGPQKG